MTPTPRPSLRDLLLIWFSLGLQSFGGGSSTFYLIHETSLRRGWLDEAGFMRAWALAQIAPGINLAKLTILIGYELRGWPGVVVSLTGLLLPSAIVTALMTAGFTLIRESPDVRAALRGLLPATIGLSLAMAYQMAFPLLRQAQREGGANLALHVAILIGSALLLALAGLSPLAILAVAGASAVVLLALLSRGSRQVRE